ncbi:MAG: tripartite tricarboxylate transporter substrate binding protein [Burkholderiales bacterium]|jgi:tripartite-type tricarboxylate transporter receptor subunit TctC
MTRPPDRPRRAFAVGLAGAAVAAAALPSRDARAQAGPSTSASGRVTRLLVGFPPGQATDQVARLIAERLATATGQPFIVENRPGQGGSLMLSQLVRSPADGSSITLSALAAYVVNPVLYKTVSYDAVRDLDPIAMVADLPTALCVHPSVPAQTLKELIDYARANPDALAHVSAGNGTLSHLMMEDFKQRAGIRILHVPYPGSPQAMVDLVAGTVKVGLDTVTVTAPHVKAGRLRMLGIGTRERLPDFPQVPTIAESGFPGFEAVAWIALSAPKGTPRELRERLSAEVGRALREPDFAGRLRAIGAVPRPMGVDELGAFIAAEQPRWKAIVERSGAKVD